MCRHKTSGHLGEQAEGGEGGGEGKGRKPKKGPITHASLNSVLGGSFWGVKGLGAEGKRCVPEGKKKRFQGYSRKEGGARG